MQCEYVTIVFDKQYFLTVFHTLPFILLFVTWVSLWTLPWLFRSTFPT